jgi:hypothetical protein
MVGDHEAYPERNPSVRVASAIVLLVVLMACSVETTPQPTGSPSADVQAAAQPDSSDKPAAQDEEGRPAKKE